MVAGNAFSHAVAIGDVVRVRPGERLPLDGNGAQRRECGEPGPESRLKPAG